MKNLNLEQIGVQEMDAAEVKKTNGGFWWLIAGILIGECLDRGAGKDFRDGWNAAM